MEDRVLNSSATDSERMTLARLRDDFEAKGYQFVADPSGDQLPDFLGSYRPDAIAIGQDDKVIIEVKQPGSRPVKIPSTSLSERIASQGGWRYLLVYAGQDPSEIIELSRPQKSQVDEALEETRRLKESGYTRAAMIECWSLLEALARRLYPADIRFSLKPLSPMEVVERLAMDGQVSDADAKRLRALTSIRNSLVHGDLDARVRPDDVEYLLNKIEEINSRVLQ